MELKSFKDIIDENKNITESKKDWENIYKSLKGVKTGVGSSVQEWLKEYQTAVYTVISAPSSIKPYLEEINLEFPDEDKINKLIDVANELQDLMNAKFK